MYYFVIERTPKMLKIKKLVPDSETGNEVIYFNKANDY